MSDQAQFIVLCEDLQSQVFIRRALMKRGASSRRIYCEALPSTSGSGAADAYVIKKYPGQVKAFRARNSKASTGLVVHVDADPAQTVPRRHAQLAETLKKSDLPPRGKDEPIAELVPKRNIETWIYSLDSSLLSGLGEAPDENTEYRKLRGHESDCASAAEAFAEHARQHPSPSTAGLVPSLRDGLREFGRLPKLPSRS
jgi:hypothetical protein